MTTGKHGLGRSPCWVPLACSWGVRIFSRHRAAQDLRGEDKDVGKNISPYTLVLPQTPCGTVDEPFLLRGPAFLTSSQVMPSPGLQATL